ncbi:MAG: hypothetical protein GY699_11215 [Desulfobacteraceae bacterium]|nr:hypothetical protein [Desulfobacteraceae bacterium]
MKKKQLKVMTIILFFAAAQLCLMFPVPVVFSQPSVTPLSVVQLGIEKIETMIAAKKLNADWPKKFSNVSVFIRNIKGFSEYALEFTSIGSSTPKVILYFEMNGEYSGISMGK